MKLASNEIGARLKEAFDLPLDDRSPLPPSTFGRADAVKFDVIATFSDNFGPFVRTHDRAWRRRPMSLEDDLTQELLTGYQRSGEEVGY